MSDTPSTPFLEVKDLKVHFPTDDGLVKSVDGLSFSVERGKTLGIVGESGSGKSVTSQAVLGLHRGTRARTSGQILLDGEDLMSVDNDRMRQLRGRKMSMIFQDPLSALHPYYTIGSQIIEAIQVHHQVRQEEGPHPGDRGARAGRHPQPAAARRPVPPRVLRWHAPAGDDRDVPGQRPPSCSSPTSRRPRST